MKKLLISLVVCLILGVPTLSSSMYFPEGVFMCPGLEAIYHCYYTDEAVV